MAVLFLDAQEKGGSCKFNGCERIGYPAQGIEWVVYICWHWGDEQVIFVVLDGTPFPRSNRKSFCFLVTRLFAGVSVVQVRF